MESLAHKYMSLGGYHSDRRPSRDEFTGLNLNSDHATDLIAVWPMWGNGETLIDLTSYGVVAYPVNVSFVFDDQMGWVYQGTGGGVAHNGAATPTKPEGYQILAYPQHLDRG